MLKLPRDVENDVRADEITKLLGQNLSTLWDQGTIQLPHLDYSEALHQALNDSIHHRESERGLEKIEELLASEQKGLLAVQHKMGTPPPMRMSRLLIIADGGSERFYRSVERILIRHSERLIGLRIGIPFEDWSKLLFGDEQLAKALLISDRNSVCQVLFSLCEPEVA